MKLKIVLATTVFIALLLINGNEYIQRTYNTSLFDFATMEDSLSEEEKAILQNYGVLVYGGNINEPPLGVYNPDNMQYTGLLVDYMNALSIELGYSIVCKPMLWRDAIHSLKLGETDMCDMIASRERGNYFAFTNPLYHLKGVAVVKSEKNTTKLADLNGLTIAVQESDYSLEILESLLPDSQLILTDSVKTSLLLLENDEVNVAVGDDPVIRFYLNDMKTFNEYEIISETVYDQSCVIAVPKEKANLMFLSSEKSPTHYN